MPSKYRQLLMYVVVALLYYLTLFSDSRYRKCNVLTIDWNSSHRLCGFDAVSVKFGYYWYFPIIIGLLWIPNLFLLNDSAAIYILMYAVVSLIGQLIGLLFKK